MNPKEGHSPAHLARQVRARALQLGFDDVRIGPAGDLAGDREHLRRWLEAGMHGEMEYMTADALARAEPERLLPGARSAVVLAASYFPGERPSFADPAVPGRVARYAWGRDYHRILGRRLKLLREFLTRLVPGCKTRSFVDSHPLLERALARRAGLGFVGKNTMLIHRHLGSWVFLAAVLTDVELPPDAPDPGDCGRCTLCLEACPTQAFAAPYVLDARRCISYWTIEAPGPHPPELAPLFGDWVFGCDRCQEVCPYNHRPLDPGPGRRFQASRTAGPWIDAARLVSLDRTGFRALFRKSPLNRPGHTGLARNARTVLANRLRRDRF